VEVRDSTCGVADEGGGPLFRTVCSNYRGITLLSLPGNVYSRVLERRIRPTSIDEPQLQVQCGFCPGLGTVDQLFTLARLLEGSWKFGHPIYMYFVDLEKAYDGSAGYIRP